MADPFPTALQRISDERWVTLDVVTRERGRLVARVAEAPDHAAVVRWSADEDYDRHLRQLLASPPPDSGPGIHITWPTDLLHDLDARVVGYLAPRITGRSTFPLADFLDPTRRAEIAPMATRRHQLRVARNIATAVAALHHAGHGRVRGRHLRLDDRARVIVVRSDELVSAADAGIIADDERRLGYLIQRLVGGRPWTSGGQLGVLLARDAGRSRTSAETWFHALRDAERNLPEQRVSVSPAAGDDSQAEERIATPSDLASALRAAEDAKRSAASTPPWARTHSSGPAATPAAPTAPSGPRKPIVIRVPDDDGIDRPSPDRPIPIDSRLSADLPIASSPRVRYVGTNTQRAEDPAPRPRRRVVEPATDGDSPTQHGDTPPTSTMRVAEPATGRRSTTHLEGGPASPGALASPATSASPVTSVTRAPVVEPAAHRAQTLVMPAVEPEPNPEPRGRRGLWRATTERSGGAMASTTATPTPSATPATTRPAASKPDVRGRPARSGETFSSGMARATFTIAFALLLGGAASVAPFAAFIAAATVVFTRAAVDTGQRKATMGRGQQVAITASRLLPFATGGIALAAFVLLDLLLVLGLVMAIAQRLFEYGPGFTLTWILDLPEVPVLVRWFAFVVAGATGLSIGGGVHDSLKARTGGRRMLATPAFALAIAVGLVVLDAGIVWWPLPTVG
ncbi:hypothetical protein [Euzebya rosea]|uniref:hypothetical protein n=1 Tax=Euzebya rosea TaxID=2052804 RepID=UPI000D3E05B7|nr:hypothetical protein [Euzebya rosea]